MKNTVLSFAYEYWMRHYLCEEKNKDISYFKELYNKNEKHLNNVFDCLRDKSIPLNGKAFYDNELFFSFFLYKGLCCNKALMSKLFIYYPQLQETTIQVSKLSVKDGVKGLGKWESLKSFATTHNLDIAPLKEEVVKFCDFLAAFMVPIYLEDKELKSKSKILSAGILYSEEIKKVTDILKEYSPDDSYKELLKLKSAQHNRGNFTTIDLSKRPKLQKVQEKKIKESEIKECIDCLINIPLESMHYIRAASDFIGLKPAGHDKLLFKTTKNIENIIWSMILDAQSSASSSNVVSKEDEKKTVRFTKDDYKKIYSHDEFISRISIDHFIDVLAQVSNLFSSKGFDLRLQALSEIYNPNSSSKKSPTYNKIVTLKESITSLKCLIEEGAEKKSAEKKSAEKKKKKKK